MVMGNESLVSVVIPVYNGEDFLAEAVESVLGQDYHPMEIIIVDDGSTDGTAEVAASFGSNVRYVYQPNAGPPAARNTGLKTARGDVIGFLDADDLWTENKLELQLPLLTGDPGPDIVIGRKQLIGLKGGKGVMDGRLEYEIFSDPMTALSLGCAVFRRSVFEKVGLFDETLHQCDDWDWFMRVRELGVSMLMHPEVVQFCRRHEHNITNQVRVGNHYTMVMLKKSLDRRRENKKPATSLPKLSGLETPAEKPDNRKQGEGEE